MLNLFLNFFFLFFLQDDDKYVVPLPISVNHTTKSPQLSHEEVEVLFEMPPIYNFMVHLALGRIQCVLTAGKPRVAKDLTIIHAAYTNRVLPRKVFNYFAKLVSMKNPELPDRAVALKVYYLTSIMGNNLMFHPKSLNFYKSLE